MPSFASGRSLRRRVLERAAATYDGAAVLQREVGDRLLDRLQFLDLEVSHACDLGCRTGLATRLLCKRFRGARVVGIDLAEAMLAATRRRRPFRGRLSCVCGDMAALPIRSAGVDLLFSNLALHWCDPLDAVLAEMRRVLRPGGALVFSTFGPDTLCEWRTVWNSAAEAEAIPLLDMHDVGDALIRAGLVEPVMDVERITLQYRDVSQLLGDLRALGERNVSSGRRRALTGKGRWTAAVEGYERYRDAGVLPATFEVVYGMAWAPPDVSGAASSRGQASIPVEALKRQLLDRRR